MSELLESSKMEPKEQTEQSEQMEQSEQTDQSDPTEEQLDETEKSEETEQFEETDQLEETGQLEEREELEGREKVEEGELAQALDQAEQVLDEDTWPKEAEAIIREMRKHVKSVNLSPIIKSNSLRTFINLTTLENYQYCIEMSANGFKIVGRKYDDVSLRFIERECYETPYALLNTISKKYRESFGGELMNKLMDLAKKSEG